MHIKKIGRNLLQEQERVYKNYMEVGGSKFNTNTAK